MNDNFPDALKQRLFKPEFPRSSNYDPHWLMANEMGPHALWLADWLSQRLDLTPGMRILDLGCGKALSSIFLAKGFGVSVWAADYWITANENMDRIEKAGFSSCVFPVSVEAHALPFAQRSFDAIVSFDAYHYFGTDDLYLGYISSFLRPGGRLGIVVPGTPEELSEIPPPHLAQFWVWDFCSFHSPGWWRRHWEKTGLLEIETADTLTDGWKHWLEWDELCEQFGQENRAHLAHREAEMLRVDEGRTFGFTRLIAKRMAGSRAGVSQRTMPP
jgi:cyclopropane fatty-acyl-phospholipid synthase-like methyltransferase